MKNRFVPAIALLSAGLLLVACGDRGRSRNTFEKWVDRQFAVPDAKDEAVYITEERGGKKEDILVADFSKVKRPGGPGEFTRLPHLPPVEQGETGTCWSFATTSLLESELKRLGKPEVKLSELHAVYWEYVEKARRFVREKGAMFLGQGSQPASALERLKQYGIVRASDYPGLPAGRTRHDHTELFREFQARLEDARAKAAWDEAAVIADVRAILDRHLGPPPGRISVDGRAVTPSEYLEGILGLRPADYVCLISFKYLPFYTKGEYRVPDNWWRDANYHNVPLYEFYLATLRALRRGFTVALAADISEAGNRGEENTAIVPTFDVPSHLIDQSAREFRFANRTTTDDHVVHCVGYKEKDKNAWFLVKDSWETAYRGPHKGYFFYRDDYLRLKVLMIMTHRDAVKEFLEKFAAAK
jgi:bleomycin hydrolase